MASASASPRGAAVGRALHDLSAREAVALLRAGNVSPLQLIDAVEARIAATDGVVRATPILCFERARARAKELVHPAEPAPGYLWGLPVLIKDINPVEGVQWTCGSEMFRNRVAEYSGPIVRQLEAMGALIVGKTNVPEFAAGSHTFNSVYGTTVSPYDIRTSAGGSSGGSAAALSCGQIALATGNDLGGSLRIPAAFCGVVGFRVSPGRTPRRGAGVGGDNPEPAHGLHAIEGPMARSVGDVALLLDAMTDRTRGQAEGWDGYRCPAHPSTSWQRLAEEAGIDPLQLRVGYSTMKCAVAQQVDDTCRAAALKLASLDGSTLNFLDEPFPCAIAETSFHQLRALCLAGTFTEDFNEDELLQLKPELQWNIRMASQLGDKGMAQLHADALAANLGLQEAISQLFKEHDVLLTPATLDAAFDAGLRYPTAAFGSGHSGSGDMMASFSNYLDWMLPTTLISMTSCPALVMPAGVMADGRPIGVQIVGAPGADAMVLRAAASLEALLGTGGEWDIPCNPRRGSCPLTAEGPRTVQEAAAHHAAAADVAFRTRYLSPE